MRLTKFNPETGLYEYVEKAKTLDEYRAQRKAAIQKLGEYEDNDGGDINVLTIEKIKLMFTMRFGTYTDGDMTPIKEVFTLLDKFEKEMLEDAE